jgi:hypothetical protein
MGATTDAALAELLSAENLLRSGAPDAALALLENLDRIGSVPDNLRPTVHAVRGLALHRTGDRDGGRFDVERAIAVARAQGGGHQLALALDALASLTPSDEAGSEAEAIFAELGVVIPPAWPRG